MIRRMIFPHECNGDDKTTNDIVPVTDTWGGSPSFDYSDEWSNQWGSGSSKAESYAVEKLTDGTFNLAIKRTDQYGDDVNINWEILQFFSSTPRVHTMLH